MLVMKLYWQSEFLQKGSSIGIHSSHRVVADFRAVIYSFADNLIYDIYIKCLQTAFWSLLLYTERHFLLLPILFLMKICLVYFFCLFILAHMYRRAYMLIGWEAHVWEFQRSTLGIFHQIVSFHILFWSRVSLGLELIYWVLLANQWQICLSAFLALGLQPHTL